MNPISPFSDARDTTNRLLNPVNNTTPNLSASNPTPQSSTQPSTVPPSAATRPWSSQSPIFANNNTAPNFPQFSASTEEILKRVSANASHAAGTAAFEAKKAEILQTFMTSDKLPTPPPIPNSGRRGGRGGGRVGTPSQLKSEVSGIGGTPGASSTPGSGRGSGRGRGRGRGGGKGGKRKRAESVESENDSDISSSYTPLPTRTKSGRNVNKPIAFVPTLPEPAAGVKRRRSTKVRIEAAQCKICHRGTDPGNNRIVFCDVCNTAYHQYCHDPPIDNEVVNVLEKEWLCGPCERSKQSVVEGMDGLTAGDGLSIEEKRAYLSTLSQVRLISLLLHSTIRHPELPIFPPNVRDLVPDSITNTTAQPPTSNPPPQPPTPQNSRPQHVPSPTNGMGSTGGTPRSQHIATDSSEMDPAEAQLLGEIRSSHQTHLTSPPQTHSYTTSSPKPVAPAPSEQQIGQYDDGYDTDPPAHYPKAGHGLARTMRPESEDLQWLVDDNFEVFSHEWKGDGTGVGADAGGGVNGNGFEGSGEATEGVVQGAEAKVA
ncbi:hypothetical protein K469DRAFT_622924 [Zopfia rhizophila CBS 207.26]|uniref:PHD-type domain-containing protein n=1 Tax=Zopfia rhizophila CBS 207.26 TaxID=1314779 RepID=A0A6A6EH10_9PEZI|nr:hypothetical protein K469DRAFT_622924 [Zopfia rhizophila CBS 207.26]